MQVCTPAVSRHNEVLVPDVIKDDHYLMSLYNETDLDYAYVALKCEILSRMKMIDLAKENVMEWYSEFLKAKWTKKIFDNQFEAIKLKEVFGRLDIATWLKSERMYTEPEFRAGIRNEVDKLISRGRSAIKNGARVSKDAEIEIRAAAADEAIKTWKRERSNIIDEIQEQEKTRVREILKDREKRIAGLSYEQKSIILTICLEKGLIIANSEPEKIIALKYLHKYADVITDGLLSGFQISECNDAQILRGTGVEQLLSNDNA